MMVTLSSTKVPHLSLNRCIRFEDQQHRVLMGNEGVGELGATEPAQYLPVRGVAVVHHDVIIGALLVGLQLELGEPQLDPVTRSGGEYPDTLLTIC